MHDFSFFVARRGGPTLGLFIEQEVRRASFEILKESLMKYLKNPKNREKSTKNREKNNEILKEILKESLRKFLRNAGKRQTGRPEAGPLRRAQKFLSSLSDDTPRSAPIRI